MEERNIPFETFKMLRSALTSITVGVLVVITYWYQVAFSILAVTGACIVLYCSDCVGVRCEQYTMNDVELTCAAVIGNIGKD